MECRLRIMKLSAVMSMILTAIFFISCGGGDDINPPGPDLTAPFITLVSPADGETGVSVVPIITVFFRTGGNLFNH